MKRYDESPLMGTEISTKIPISTQELKQMIAEANCSDHAITCLGSATNFVGSAVPDGSIVIRTEKLNALKHLKYIQDKDEFLLTVGAGITIDDLDAMLMSKNLHFDQPDEETLAAYDIYVASQHSYHFPPDPSEGSATLGGIFSAPSNGSSSYYYGRGERYFVNAVLIDYLGERHVISMDKNNVQNQSASISSFTINDLYGSEAKFGIIAELTIRLLKRPALKWSTLINFETFVHLINFKKELKQLEDNNGARIIAFNFFDNMTIQRTIDLSQVFPLFAQMTAYKGDGKYAAYLEIEGEDEDSIVDLLSEILMLADMHSSFAESAVAATSSSEVKQMRALWHTCIEGMNYQIVRSEDRHFSAEHIMHVIGEDDELTHFYNSFSKEALEKEIRFFSLGHIGVGDLFLRIMPDSGDGKIIVPFYEKYAELSQTLSMEPSLEFGIGQLKRKFIDRFK